MRKSIVAGSLMAASVCTQLAANSVPPGIGEMLEHGFDAAILDSPLPTSTGGPAVEQADLQQRVSIFISGLFESWSSPNAQALQVLNGLYEDAVTYYGKVISREAVLEDKRRFVERWPQRSYIIRPGTLIVQCGAGSLRCTVSGTTDWSAAKDAKRSTGAAHFYYAVRAAEDGLLKIAAETSKVVQGPLSSSASGHSLRAANKTACTADGAEILRENAVCRN
jgi:hypothetical protein